MDTSLKREEKVLQLEWKVIAVGELSREAC
jgi:hypothetical protein